MWRSPCFTDLRLCRCLPGPHPFPGHEQPGSSGVNGLLHSYRVLCLCLFVCVPPDQRSAVRVLFLSFSLTSVNKPSPSDLHLCLNPFFCASWQYSSMTCCVLFLHDCNNESAFSITVWFLQLYKFGVDIMVYFIGIAQCIANQLSMWPHCVLNYLAHHWALEFSKCLQVYSFNNITPPSKCLVPSQHAANNICKYCHYHHHHCTV